jgi:hypothetical protein
VCKMKISTLLVLLTLVVGVFDHVCAAGGAMSRDIGKGMGGDNEDEKMPAGDP